MYWAANVSDVGDRITGTIAVPLAVICCVALGALSLTLIVPGWDPTAVGVKLMAMVHIAPGATVVGDIGQVVPAVLSEYPPVRPVMELIVSEVDRLFVSVKL